MYYTHRVCSAILEFTGTLLVAPHSLGTNQAEVVRELHCAEGWCWWRCGVVEVELCDGACDGEVRRPLFT